MNPNQYYVEHTDSRTGRTYTTKHRGPSGSTAVLERPTETVTEDWTPVDLLAHDPMPLPQDHRAQVCWAFRAAARVNGGIIHAGIWREYLPEAINPKLIGAVVSSLAQSGAIRWTGEFVPSGNAKSRNNRKPVLEWHVVDMAGVR